MDRRKSLQTILLGGAAAGTGLVFDSCKTDSTENIDAAISESSEKYFGRTPEELERIEKLNAEQLFNEHETETIAALSVVILPPKENLLSSWARIYLLWHQPFWAG